MNAYRIDFDETNCMYFMIKEEKVFDKFMETWEKVSNMIKKKFNSERICSKKYLIAKKIFSTKESFQSFYRNVIRVPVILTDSVYRKDENYYPKVLFKKIFILMIVMILMILMKKFQERKF